MSNNDIVTITPNVLPSLDTVTQQVSNNGAGAIVTFSGCTRDTFQGKRVLRLEYEAYEPMAIKVLKELIAEARSKWDLTHVAIYHRTGVVPVSQVSVIIAVSSAHRAEAFRASEYLIDTLKERCPIWKKEVYEDGSVWKGQCCNHNQA